MHRTQIYLDGDQRRLLKGIAREQGVTLSELIRQAIWRLITTLKSPTKTSLNGIVGLYRDDADTSGSADHDDIYE